MTERLLSPEECASRLQVSRPMVYKLISEGKLPPFFKLGPRVSRVREADFNSALEQFTHQ